MSPALVRTMTLVGSVWVALAGLAAEAPHAVNLSAATECAEEDNVNIAIAGAVSLVTIEATHPAYDVGVDSCEPDFTRCPPPPPPGYPFSPGTWTLFDDGITVVQAVRVAEWWRASGMDARVDDGGAVEHTHYVVVSRKIAGANEWPQFFVLYTDGNMRLIPHPPVGRQSVCFGSSVIIGPAAAAARPIAEIMAVRYHSAEQTLEVHYAAGGWSLFGLGEVDRDHARVTVEVHYPTDELPFGTFRSMYVEQANADVDHVQWLAPSGASLDAPVMTFAGGSGREWFFHRTTRSIHNTSAPDIRVWVDTVFADGFESGTTAQWDPVGHERHGSQHGSAAPD